MNHRVNRQATQLPTRQVSLRACLLRSPLVRPPRSQVVSHRASRLVSPAANHLLNLHCTRARCLLAYRHRSLWVNHLFSLLPILPVNQLLGLLVNPVVNRPVNQHAVRLNCPLDSPQANRPCRRQLSRRYHRQVNQVNFHRKCQAGSQRISRRDNRQVYLRCAHPANQAYNHQ